MTAFARLGDPIPPLAAGQIVQANTGVTGWTVGLIGLANFPRAAVAPTSGTHVVGEIVIFTTPTAGGYLGSVCVTAGTPGIWKGFGLIQA